MSVSRSSFRTLLREDEERCFPWERINEREVQKRALAVPATYMGSGRNRFWEVLRHLDPDLQQHRRIGDFGAYPGTTFRLARRLAPDSRSPFVAAGFGFSAEFKAAMAKLGVELAEMEFDLRAPQPNAEKHILEVSLQEMGGPLDVAVCTEVVEHQLQPLSLLAGLNRFLKPGGTVHVTTNSATFVGDILKLAVGRHNVEALDRSHVLSQTLWRPHMRLYTLTEVSELLSLCGFSVLEGRYFDNGNVYRGVKGASMTALRSTVGAVPHLRSHIWVTATKTGQVSEVARQALARSFGEFGLGDLLGSSDDGR